MKHLHMHGSLKHLQAWFNEISKPCTLDNTLLSFLFESNLTPELQLIDHTDLIILRANAGIVVSL